LEEQIVPGKRRPGRHISKKAVQKLLNEGQWKSDPEFADRNPSAVYRHPDSRVLYDSGDSGILAEEDEGQAFIEHLRNVQREYKAWLAENPHGRSVLVGLLPQGENFVEQIPMLINELSKILRLSPEELDFSEASLEKVDAKLKRLGRKKCLQPPIFPALVAYTGEVFRQRYQGEWHMKHDNLDKRVWEPWVVIPSSNNACRIALGLYDAFMERSLSIRKAIPLYIGSWQLLPPEFWESDSDKITQQ
jgi:hypothetical protein